MNRIGELRKERGYSLRGLEIKTGINYSSLAKFENETREPGIADIKTMADFFQVSIDYLLCYNGFCLYAYYPKGNFMFKIRDEYYQDLKQAYIYFNDKDLRCIDINKLVGVHEDADVMEVFYHFIRFEKFEDDSFFKGKDTEDIAKYLDKEITDIELTKELVELVKKALE